MAALVVAHAPILSRVLDIASPLSASSFWVRVRVSVRPCYRFSGLHAFHSSDSVAVGIRRPRFVALMSYKAPASSRLALLQLKAVAAWCTTSARKAHMRMTLYDGVSQKRSRTSSACFVGTSAGIVVFRITRSQGARDNTTSGTPLHHSRRRLCAESISLCEAALALFFSFCMSHN